MTDTAAPKDSLVRTAATALVAMAKSMITTTCTAIAAHWDKAINGVLGAGLAVFLVWFTGHLNKPAPAPAPVVKTVEIVRTVPSNLEAKIDALARDVSDLKAAMPKKKK